MDVIALAAAALLIVLYGVAGVTATPPVDTDQRGGRNRLLWMTLDGSFVSLATGISYTLWEEGNKAPAIVLAAIALANVVLQFQSPTANRQYGAIWKYMDGMSIATLLLILLTQIYDPRIGTCTSTRAPERSRRC